MIFGEEVAWNTPHKELVIDFLRHVFLRLLGESKAISVSEFLPPKSLEEGDCGDYLERILTGVLSELKHESAKILLDSLFMLSNFHFKVLRKLVCLL